MDLVTSAPRIPLAGETLLGGDFNTYPGGKGANQAVAASRLGGRVTMVGCVGSDGFGGELLDNLAQSGVDTAYVRRSAVHATGIASIIVAASAENVIVVAPGANADLSLADIDAAAARIAAADILLVQLEIPLEVVAYAVHCAHAGGAATVLNPAPARELPADLFREIDYLVPNQKELGLLSGLPCETLAEVERACRQVRPAGPRTLVTTLGDQGAFQFDGASGAHVPAYPVHPVDTTAAGDAFVAGLSVALAEGKSLEEAVRWGCAAGALAATRRGAQPSLPYRREVEELIEKIGR